MINLDGYIEQLAGDTLENVGSPRNNVHWTHGRDQDFPTIVCAQVAKYTEEAEDDRRKTWAYYLLALYSTQDDQLAKLEDSCLDQMKTRGMYVVDICDGIEIDEDEISHQEHISQCIAKSKWISNGSLRPEIYGDSIEFTLHNATYVYVYLYRALVRNESDILVGETA